MMLSRAVVVLLSLVIQTYFTDSKVYERQPGTSHSAIRSSARIGLHQRVSALEHQGPPCIQRNKPKLPSNVGLTCALSEYPDKNIVEASQGHKQQEPAECLTRTLDPADTPNSGSHQNLMDGSGSLNPTIRII